MQTGLTVGPGLVVTPATVVSHLENCSTPQNSTADHAECRLRILLQHVCMLRRICSAYISSSPNIVKSLVDKQEVCILPQQAHRRLKSDFKRRRNLLQDIPYQTSGPVPTVSIEFVRTVLAPLSPGNNSTATRRIMLQSATPQLTFYSL